MNRFNGCRCIKFGVERLDWPAQSPALNLSEHLWDELEQKLHFWFSHPTMNTLLNLVENVSPTQEKMFVMSKSVFLSVKIPCGVRRIGFWPMTYTMLGYNVRKRKLRVARGQVHRTF
ncbi:hypothetical protein XENORESO_015484 [Xenotaenia resolanae]|uniref:Transposase n=1 Tax=Xenotaenia resolanae TaxID=208358 RepID=A0ABV0X4X2_9TELE